MFTKDGLFKSIWFEIDQAKASRAAGMEGRARVHARRALASAFLTYSGSIEMLEGRRNVLSVISKFAESDLLSGESKRNISHFLTPVNTNYELPEGIDLIEEAISIIQELQDRRLKD